MPAMFARGSVFGARDAWMNAGSPQLEFRDMAVVVSAVGLIVAWRRASMRQELLKLPRTARNINAARRTLGASAVARTRTQPPRGRRLHRARCSALGSKRGGFRRVLRTDGFHMRGSPGLLSETGPVLPPSDGGANRDRTGDLLLAKQALSQLSYGPRAPSLGDARRHGDM
jgi:hypothetical protein